MKYQIRSLFMLLVLLFSISARGGNNVMDKISNGVCDCLNTCKKNDASVKGSAFQGCIEQVTKPYMKDLKKMFSSSGGESFDRDAMTKLAMQLGMSMSQKCPAMLEYILQEMPELQGD